MKDDSELRRRFYLDAEGRVRSGECPEGGVPFTGVVTVPFGREIEGFDRHRTVARIRDGADVAAVFRHSSGLIKKQLWVLYCDGDGAPTGVEMVGLGGRDSRWSAREVLYRAFGRAVARVSLVSNDAYDALDPPDEDLAQRRMFQRAAAALGITIDHQVFVGLDGFAEVQRSGEFTRHGWDEAPRPRKKVPVIEGYVDHVVPDHPRLAVTLERQITTVDEAEAVARELLVADERVALAVLQVANGGEVTGVFPVGCADWLDEDSARLAFSAGFRGFCHRVVVLASGEGGEWETRIENYLGPGFLDWVAETYLLETATVLVRRGDWRVWGSLPAR